MGDHIEERESFYHIILFKILAEQQRMIPYQPLNLVNNIRLLFAAYHQKYKIKTAFTHTSKLNYTVDTPVSIDVPLEDNFVILALNPNVFLF